MLEKFYSENEEINFEESLNKYEFLLKEFNNNPPSLKEALIEMFRNADLSEKEAKEIYDHLYLVCSHQIEKNKDFIKAKYEEISDSDALAISSYTYEPKKMYQKYGPYRLLNTNLVETNRKNGVINVEKYLFVFLKALRKLKKIKINKLFRCINCKVKTEKDPNNAKFIPYVKGNQKIFWPFTSTSYDEEECDKFLNDNNGTGTKFIMEGKNLWGYDISLFNVCGEKEILLEPERKYIIENIKEGKITEITCKMIDAPQVLYICDCEKNLTVRKYYFIF